MPLVVSGLTAAIGDLNSADKHAGGQIACVNTHPSYGCSTPHMLKNDLMLSTEGIYKRPSVSKANEFVVVTETGILHRLKKDYPDRTFIPVSEDAICGYMKKISLEKVLWSLQDLQYEVKVPPEVAAKAKTAIDRMMAVA